MVSGELVGVAVSVGVSWCCGIYEFGLVWWYLRGWAGVVVSGRVGWCGGISGSGLVWRYPVEWVGVVVSGE